MKTFLRVFSVIFLIAWMGLIFCFSSQTADESSRVSGNVIEIVAEKINPEFKNMSYDEKQEVIDSLQSTVRTAAHGCIYFVLGFFAFLTFVSYTNQKFKIRLLLMFSISFLYAISDEIHQNFVDGRAMQLFDIGVDTLGIILALGLCSLFAVLIRPIWLLIRYDDPQKTLVDLNNELYEKLDESFYMQTKIEKEIEEYKAMSEEKKEENIILSEPQEEKTQLSEEFEYAAAIIGKTVVESTKICNELSFNNQSAESLELVNLILGRTEVLKAEILKIVKSETDLDTKKDLMQSEQASAYDYFNSIKAQIS